MSADAGHTLTELDSGIRVVTEALPSVRSVALGFWIGTGSRYERVEQAGVSHFLEHLLFKGTDGLLHISNVSPGERAETVESVVNRGDELAVRVVEVDKERGRIGLRRADDPEIAGKSAEELAGVGTGGGGGGGGGRDRGPRRNGRERGRGDRDPDRG